MNALVDWLPRPGDEAYKYTSFAALARRKYAAPAPGTVDAAQLPAPFGARLLFVDGRLQDRDGAPECGSGAPHRDLPESATALRKMNAALATESITLDIPPDTDAGVIELLFASSDHATPVASYPQVTVTVGANAKVTLVERHVALGEAQDFTNLAIDMQVARGACVTHIALQQGATGAALATGLHATLAVDAQFDSHAVHLGGALVRADLTVTLAGRGARCALYGVHLPGMRQHIDTHTRIEHMVRDTTSVEEYRAVVDRGGRSVFNGKVFVAKGADGTDAQQFNANLLLSEQAEADTKPELEIYADDVKCAHGATVGKLDEAAMFYLRTRGIGVEAARSVLIWAFVETVLTKIPLADARRSIEDAVLARLPDAGLIGEFR
ncbi:MAG: Fe-S cluster assembly protein SufD [Xanthomonadaceae bacterium]|nr:Fe-S cluster assembly protein SufD [Xanthomonadaceae bacterium]